MSKQDTLTGGPVLATRDRKLINQRTVIRAKAPLRISFVGGGTDIPAYYEQHGTGAVLSTTINRYSFVTLYPRDDKEVRIRSLDLGYSVNYAVDQDPIYDGILDLVKAAIRRMGSDVGFELDVHTDAPPGSGLGSSSAVTAAILGVLMEYTGVIVNDYELAELNYIIERKDLKIAGGKQDQYATTFGGFNLIEFHPDRVDVTPLRLNRDLLNDLDCHLMLCYTGRVRPGLGLVDRQIKLMQEQQPVAMDSMKRLHAMVYELKEILLKGRLQQFGELLDEARAMKQRMNPNASHPEIENMYMVAKEHGAIGGKLLGAGGGGYLLLFVHGNRRHEVRQAVEHTGGQFAAFAFEKHGLQVWRSTCR